MSQLIFISNFQLTQGLPWGSCKRCLSRCPVLRDNLWLCFEIDLILSFKTPGRLQERAFMILTFPYLVVVFHVVERMITEIMSLIHNPLEGLPVVLWVHEAEALGQGDAVYEKRTLRKEIKYHFISSQWIISHNIDISKDISWHVIESYTINKQ